MKILNEKSGKEYFLKLFLEHIKKPLQGDKLKILIKLWNKYGTPEFNFKKDIKHELSEDINNYIFKTYTIPIEVNFKK